MTSKQKIQVPETKEEFLENTVKYYNEDVNRRCVLNDAKCFYSPENAGKENISDGCAIGRFLTKEQQKRFDKFQFNGVATNEVFTELSEDMKKHGPLFLCDIQHLHDHNDFWNKKGISQEGRRAVLRIIKDFNLDKTKIDLDFLKIN